LKTELWPPHGWFAWERSVLFSSSVCPVNNRKCLIIVASLRELPKSMLISSSDRLGFMHHWIKRSVVVAVVATWKIWTWQQICLSTYLTLSTSSPTCNATQAFVFSKYISYLWPWLPSSWPFFYCCLHKHFVAVVVVFFVVAKGRHKAAKTVAALTDLCTIFADFCGQIVFIFFQSSRFCATFSILCFADTVSEVNIIFLIAFQFSYCHKSCTSGKLKVINYLLRYHLACERSKFKSKKKNCNSSKSNCNFNCHSHFPIPIWCSQQHAARQHVANICWLICAAVCFGV